MDIAPQKNERCESIRYSQRMISAGVADVAQEEPVNSEPPEPTEPSRTKR